MVIFFAILLHKVPASIGLGTYLQRCQLSDMGFITYLLSFTLTSPTVAILSFIILQNLGWSIDNFKIVVGRLLLISAGTFLYVATMHILPNKDGNDHDDAGDTAEELNFA